MSLGSSVLGGLTMRHGRFIASSIAIFAIVMLSTPQFFNAQARATEASMGASKIQIPKSVKSEHEEIHSTLLEATKAPGRVGVAAKELDEKKQPQKMREEQIALPPKKHQTPKLAGDQLPENVVSEALSMTDSLRA